MSFLKDFAQGVVKALSVAEKIANPVEGIAAVLGGLVDQASPNAAPVVARVESDIAKFFAVVQNVEIMGAALNTPGPDKLKMAAPVIGQHVLDIVDQLGFKVKDKDRFAASVTGFASVSADLYNALEPK